MRAMDRLEQFAQAGAMQRGDVDRLGPVDEPELALDQRIGLLALVVALPVPLVDRDDQRAAGIEHGAEHRRVLVGDAFACVEHDHGDLAVFDRLQRLDHRELLDRLLDLPRRRKPAVSMSRYLRPSRSSSTAIESRVVPGTSEAIIRSSPRMRFTSVDLPTFGRPTNAMRTRSGSLSRISASPSSGNAASTRASSASMPCLCADEAGSASLDAVAREFAERRLRVDAVGLVDDEEGRRRDLAQPREDVVIERRRAFAPVDHEQDEVGFLGRGTRLAGRRTGEAFLAASDAAGIDQHERTRRIEPADAVIAIARDAGLVVHQRIARTRQRIEQRRFTDVGATDQGDEGQHGLRHDPTWKIGI